MESSKSMVGSTWTFMEGCPNVACNSTMLLAANERIRFSPTEMEARFEAHCGTSAKAVLSTWVMEKLPCTFRWLRCFKVPLALP